MAGKYAPFWTIKLKSLVSALSVIADGGDTVKLSFPEIKRFGNRQSWHGSVVISEGEIISGGEMAHMKSLGKTLAPYTKKFPGFKFRLAMNNLCELKIEQASFKKSKPLYSEISPCASVSLPENCQDLHSFVRGLPCHRYPVNWADLPAEGVYFLFEKGEQAHGGDRIVRVGTHREENRLPERIKTHFIGDRSNSIFRKHLGEALDRKLHLRTPKSVISCYIRKNIRFAVLGCSGSRDQREDLEARAIDILSNCPDHSSSQGWLGRHSPNSVIFKSGLWNVQGVTLKSSPGLNNSPAGNFLLLIPCSARKSLDTARVISSDMEDTILNHLSKEHAERLRSAREQVKEHFKNRFYSKSRAALDLYDGFMYRVAGFKASVIKFIKTDKGNLAIISGGYGIVLPNEMIQNYNVNLGDSYNIWIDNRLPDVISNFTDSIKAQHVVGFFSKAKANLYAKLFHQVSWSNTGVSSIRMCFPVVGEQKGLQQKVPRFLGKAVVKFIQSGCDFNALTGFIAEEMHIGCEILFEK